MANERPPGAQRKLTINDVERPTESLSAVEYQNLASPEGGLWIMDQWYPAGGITIASGAPKVGKTLLVVEHAACVVDPSVKDWHGHAVPRHGPVLYFQMDMNR